MKPSQVKITGPLGDYFEVVDREYMAKEGTLQMEIHVEIKRIKEGLPAPWHEGMEYGYGYGPNFTIEIRDGNGDVISKDESNHIMDSDELKAIMALGVDETASIKFDVKKEGGETFKIGSTFEVFAEAGGRHYSPSTAQSSNSSDEGDYNDDTSSDDVPSIPSAGDIGKQMRSAQQQVSSQMRQAQEEVRQQMRQAQEEVRQQMQQGMEDARKQMQQGMEDARRAMGL